MKWILLISFLFLGCSSIPYEDDFGFLNSAQAGSYEFPVKVKGKVCSDLEGQVGICSVRISNTEDFKISIDPMPYSYTLSVECSRQVNSDLSIDIKENSAYDFVIPKDKMIGSLSFLCIGEILPIDRKEKVSAKFEIRAKIYSSSYTKREEIHLDGNKLILGKYAKYSKVCINNKCERYNKKTEIENIPSGASISAYSESYVMRYNYFRK